MLRIRIDSFEYHVVHFALDWCCQWDFNWILRPWGKDWLEFGVHGRIIIIL